MKFSFNFMALGLAALLVAGCGSADEPADTSGSQIAEAAADRVAADDCNPSNVAAKISQAASDVQKLPESHPGYEELRAAAGKMIDTFNRLDSPDTGLSFEETAAQMCEAYEEYAATAG